MEDSLRLFHVSEEPGIPRFDPRPTPSPDAGVSGDTVWAIDESHLANYLLPRNCPRVTFGVGPQTLTGDIARFVGGTNARRIIVVEEEWVDRLSNTTLYVYDMPIASFESVDACAGYYVSRQSVIPLRVREIRRPLAEIAKLGCEVRHVQDLWPIRDGVMRSTLDYSIIRMRNAKHAN